ncbi:MAG: hypothetical protein AB201_02685 [Parcubacteria bacterium C7867-006]|nr:MAG: hypothetical protein AB201_02685 [Parcubacteria bacterium C7867-006]
MNVKLHILKQSTRLNSFEEIIRKSFEEGINKIQNKIILPNVDVVVSDNPGSSIPETGVGGYAPTANLVYININPEFSDLEKTLFDEIQSTLAHELHHCARTEKIGYGKTLLEALVSEGLADNFDIEVNNKKPKPWSVAIKDEELKDLKKKAEKDFNNDKYNHSAWFFGSRDLNIPRWAGYSLGFDIVKDYLKKTDKTASELVVTDASEFIK